MIWWLPCGWRSQADGEKATSKRLSIGRSTVSRLRGGLPCRAGTIALARQRLGLT
jgi:hypothetical protein